jgi:7-carboxy-7-deazaguanine synthase
MNTQTVRTIPISEIFFSIEGEGPHTGRPTLFIRSYGCNFTCQGFSNREMEEVEIDPNTTMAKVKTDRGCDSIYSWHPDYAKFSKDYTIEELELAMKQAVAKFYEVENYDDLPWDNIIVSITGGEPLLHQKQWNHLLTVDGLLGRNSVHVLFETNGSLPILVTTADTIYAYPGKVTFSVSPKLSNSGEEWKRAIRPKAIESFVRAGHVYLKFVSDASRESILEINKAVQEYNRHLEAATNRYLYLGRESIWLMAEGATLEQQILTQKAVAEAALRNGWSFSPRAHVWIWGNTVGT